MALSSAVIIPRTAAAGPRQLFMPSAYAARTEPVCLDDFAGTSYWPVRNKGRIGHLLQAPGNLERMLIAGC